MHDIYTPIDKTSNLTDAQHPDGQFVFNLNPSSDYFDYQGQYKTEIYQATNGYWYAFIYNFDTGYWEQMYYRSGGTSKYPYGWDIWEQHGFDNNPWPDIDRIISADNIWIYIPGTGQVIASDTYAKNISSLNGEPYSFTWNDNWYSWTVNMTKKF